MAYIIVLTHSYELIRWHNEFQNYSQSFISIHLKQILNQHLYALSWCCQVMQCIFIACRIYFYEIIVYQIANAWINSNKKDNTILVVTSSLHQKSLSILFCHESFFPGRFPLQLVHVLVFFFFIKKLAECLFQEQEFKMW